MSISKLIKGIIKRLTGNTPEQSEEPKIDVDVLNNPITPMHSPELPARQDKTIAIYQVNNPVEGESLKNFLEENQIHCIFQSFHDTAFDGMWQTGKGLGVLRVFENDRVKAEELIRDFRQSLITEAQSDAVLPTSDLTMTPPVSESPFPVADKRGFLFLLFPISLILLVIADMKMGIKLFHNIGILHMPLLLFFLIPLIYDLREINRMAKRNSTEYVTKAIFLVIGAIIWTIIIYPAWLRRRTVYFSNSKRIALMGIVLLVGYILVLLFIFGYKILLILLPHV